MIAPAQRRHRQAPQAVRPADRSRVRRRPDGGGALGPLVAGGSA
jgi:hypothetical protein